MFAAQWASLLLLSSFLWGLAWASLAWWVLSFLTKPEAADDVADSFERSRRSRLREGNLIYGLFEHGIRKMARWNSGRSPERLKKLQQNLTIATEKASGEAQVSIVFPGMIIMLACLLVVVAPFIIGGIYPT